MYADGNIKSYVLTKNNNVIILNGRQESFRCKQRNNVDDNQSFKFISYKEMIKKTKRDNTKVFGPYAFESLAKM